MARTITYWELNFIILQTLRKGNCIVLPSRMAALSRRGKTKNGVDRFRQVNKLMSVFHASVLLLIMNFVITLSK